MNILIIGDPKGTHSMSALSKYAPENIWIWENDSRHIYTIRLINDKINIVRDLSELIKKKMRFTVIIANPPYQAGTKSSGNTIWDKFVEQSLELLEDGGFLSFINPPRWRQPNDRLSYIYKDYQLVSLKINNAKTGQKVFNASTPFDVYTIEKVAPYKKTFIQFSDGVSGEYDVTKFPFIPNSMIDFWIKAFESDEEKLKVYQSYSHESRLKHMSKIKTDQHPYSIIEKLNSEGITYLYSSKMHEHHNTPKVVFRDQGKSMARIENDGCGRHIYYVLDTSDEMVNFLNSDSFSEIKESILFSQRYLSDKPLNYIPLSLIK